MFRSLQKFKFFVLRRRLASTQALSYDDNTRFPAEQGHIISSNYGSSMVVPELRLDDFVWTNYKRWPNHTATVCGITGRRYSYAELRDKSAKLACGLQKAFGLRPGELVAICLPNIPEWPIACLGALEAGAVVTTINPIYKPEEIATQLNQTSAKVIFTFEQGYPVVQKALESVQHSIKVVLIKPPASHLPERAIDFFQFVEWQELFPIQNPRTSQDVAMLPFSSGTTGIPKGVELTHFNIVCNLEQMNGHIFTNIPTTQLATVDYQESHPCILPFFHIYGMTRTLFGQLTNGCKLITLPQFTPDTFLKCLIEHKATSLQLVPPIVIFCANYDGATKKHFKSVLGVIAAGATLKKADVERFKLKSPDASFNQGFGLTETSPVCTVSPKNSENYESIGTLVPVTQAKIISTDGSSFEGLGPNEKGELLIRGPHIMRGYFNNPTATKETIVEGKWLRTGDVGHYDENGDFYITDRFKELIKVKGFQVAPAEMEEVVRRHPSVADAAVVGVKHDLFGEIPKAFVVLKKVSEGTKSEEIQKFVAEKVADYKKLEGGVVFIEEIPRTNTGKILRRVIREKFC